MTALTSRMGRSLALAASAAGLLAAGLVSSPTPAAATPAAQPSGLVQTQSLKSSETYKDFIVTYKDQSASAKATSLQRTQASADKAARGKGKTKKVRTLGTGADLVTAGTPLSPAEATAYMKELADDPNVAAVEPDIRLKPTFAPSDSLYGRQWDFTSSAGMRVPGAWDYSMGSGVVVAVVDTGYTYHPDLDANRLPGYDFVSDPYLSRDGNGRDNDALDSGDWAPVGECGNERAESSSWHGTHVAGTIAAVANSSGVVGVAPQAKFMPVRVLAECGGTLSDIADGVTWASGGSVYGVPNTRTKADIINMSLGGSGQCSVAYQNAINGAVSRGTTVVVAAGNENDVSNYYNPGNCQNVINVASTNQYGGRAYYSNYGSTVDVAAPGGDTSAGYGILSTLNAGTTTPTSATYASYQGTSMATPHIAGLAALIKSVRRDMTPAQIEAAIKSGVRPFPSACSGCGTGLADATMTMRSVTGGAAPSPAPGPSGNLIVNGGFENSSLSPWSATHADTLTANGGARTGLKYACLNDAGVFSDYRLTQTVSIPAGTTNANLSFWLSIRTQESSTTTAYDTLRVQVIDGSSVRTVATYSNLNASGYTLRSLNLGNYAGKTVQIRFLGVEDDGLATDFDIDDVSLTAS
ncbi:S8 family serine peptidase [Falsarthrobacter nasiphocae]|uniref:Serine protease n=1 Tax=Falsarthrobacter nasiphocae TaxID=189863 RepID=A0AAE3YG74_9MICC|nr:S8 family serine peptidase [Falsarthrobacter nasiphocae]MDR6891431.1 serine protease [Falsarthrobacter nasiphocae]